LEEEQKNKITERVQQGGEEDDGEIRKILLLP